MKLNEGIATLEAILFACGDPIDITKLSAAADMDTDTAEKLIAKLNDRYDLNESALRVMRLGESYQLVTREKFVANIKLALESKRQVPLSQAAMEVLAIIAYNQPVTKGFVEQVRGIDSSSVVNSLVERNLLEEHGRLDLPGRPIAYKTTENFLRCFKMSDLKELPPLPNSSDQVNFDEIEELNRLGDDSYDDNDDYDYGEESAPEAAEENSDEAVASAVDGSSETDNLSAETDGFSAETDSFSAEETPSDKEASNGVSNKDSNDNTAEQSADSALFDEADDEFDDIDIDIADEDIDSFDDALKTISDNIAEITSDS